MRTNKPKMNWISVKLQILDPAPSLKLEFWVKINNNLTMSRNKNLNLSLFGVWKQKTLKKWRQKIHLPPKQVNWTEPSKVDCWSAVPFWLAWSKSFNLYFASNLDILSCFLFAFSSFSDSCCYLRGSITKMCAKHLLYNQLQSNWPIILRSNKNFNLGMIVRIFSPK